MLPFIKELFVISVISLSIFLVLLLFVVIFDRVFSLGLYVIDVLIPILFVFSFFVFCLFCAKDFLIDGYKVVSVNRYDIVDVFINDKGHLCINKKCDKIDGILRSDNSTFYVEEYTLKYMFTKFKKRFLFMSPNPRIKVLFLPDSAKKYDNIKKRLGNKHGDVQS